MEAIGRAFCEWCGSAFNKRFREQRCCTVLCECRQVEFEAFCEAEEALLSERIDGDISGFFEEDSEDMELIRELVGDGRYDLGGEG